MRPGQKVFAVPGPGWGVRVIEPGFPAAAGGGWWDDFGAIGCCVGAYQGRGAANYAASLVNLANPGVNDLTELGGGPPNWNAVQGWFGFAALVRCFDTGLVPAADQSWSMLIQFANAVLGDTTFVCGLQEGAGAAFRQFQIMPTRVIGDIWYGNGGWLFVAPQLATGNLGVAGNTAYRNGAAEPGAMPAWGGPTTFSIYLGARNVAGLGIPNLPTAADVWAFSVYSCTLTPAEMAAVAASMAAL